MRINLNNIDAIIFDLGGVLWNIDYAVLIQAFREIGLENFDAHFAQAKQEQLFDLYEKGMISSREFCQRLQRSCKPGTTEEQIIHAWNSMLFDLPKERIQLLRNMKVNYRTFLLSNTNEIHVNWLYETLAKRHGMPNFNSLFEKVYLSNEMGMRKPDAEIFLRVLKEQHLIPEKTLFIDDSPQHVESAGKLGIHAVHLDVKTTDILELLS